MRPTIETICRINGYEPPVIYDLLSLEKAFQRLQPLHIRYYFHNMPVTHPPSPTHDFPKAIGQPATRALIGAGYTRLEQLKSVPDTELLQLHGFGPKALRIIREALAAN